MVPLIAMTESSVCQIAAEYLKLVPFQTSVKMEITASVRSKNRSVGVQMLQASNHRVYM